MPHQSRNGVELLQSIVQRAWSVDPLEVVSQTPRHVLRLIKMVPHSIAPIVSDAAENLVPLDTTVERSPSSLSLLPPMLDMSQQPWMLKQNAARRRNPGIRGLLSRTAFGSGNMMFPCRSLYL